MRARRWMAHVGVVLGVGVFNLASISAGQECPEYMDSMTVNRWFSSPSQIEVSGSYAHLGGYGLVSTVDIVAPQAPVVVGDEVVTEYKGYGRVIDLSGSGNRVSFLAAICGRALRCRSELFITEISDSRSPISLLSHYTGIDTTSEQIVASSETIFIASAGGLKILDVTDAANPVEVGYFTSPWGWGRPSGLVVEGGLVYVVLPGVGLRIVDVSDQTNPVGVGFWSATWSALDLDVSDGFAYLADGDGGLRIIDASDPADPEEVGLLDIGHGVVNVSVDGSYAAVGLAEEGVGIVDVTNKSSPEIVGVYPIDETEPDVALAGNTVFVLGDGFRVLDISLPDAPTELSSFSFQSSTTDVENTRGVMYVATGDSGLYVFDESNPDEVVESFLDTPGYALGVTLHDDLALVADDHKGLRIIDVSDSNNLVEIGFVDTPGRARRVAVAGNYAYVADGDGGLRVIDFSIPAAPVEVAAVATPEPAIDVAVQGDLAFVADGHLRVVDVINPTNPFDVTPKDAIESTTLDIEERLLYSASEDRFEIYKVSDPPAGGPSVLRFIASASLMGSARDITVWGQHAYIASLLDGESQTIWVEIFDILNPSMPTRNGSWSEAGDDPTAAVSHSRIYLAIGEPPEIVVLDNRCLTTYWVEIVTHESGLNRSRWRSDLFMSHEADSSVDLEFILHTVDGDFVAGASVDAGHQAIFEDIVDLLGYRGTGALEIQATDPIIVTSRVYSESDWGTYGAFLQAHRSSDCIGSGKLYGLRQVEGEFRTNINVTNTTDEMREVWITLYRTDGQELVRYSVEIRPGMVAQDLQPFKNRAGEPNVGWGYARVEGETGILACASVIDSRTNDAMIVPLIQ